MKAFCLNINTKIMLYLEVIKCINDSLGVWLLGFKLRFFGVRRARFYGK